MKKLQLGNRPSLLTFYWRMIWWINVTQEPGDGVMLVGNYHSFLPTKGSIFFKTMIITNNIINRNSKFSVDKSDIILCRQLLEKKKDTIFELLANSIAPTIHSHINVKKAIGCLLLSGVETILPNKTHIWGDMNVLLIEDTAVSKT